MDSTTAQALLPSIIGGGFGIIMLALQFSLKRNLDQLDARTEKQDERSEKIENSINSLRTEINSMNSNMQATAARLDTRSALVERDLGNLQGTMGKLEQRVEKVAEHWRSEHEKLEAKVAGRIEKAMADVLDTIDELKRGR